MDLLVRNAHVCTMDPDRRVLKDGAIYVRDGLIEDVGKTDELKKKYASVDETIDGNHHLVIPGFVNAHTHMFEIFFRGLGDDRDLIEWLLDVVYPVGEGMREDDVGVSAELSCIENIKSGVATIVDNHTMQTSEKAIDNVVEAVYRVGARAYVSRGMRIRTPRAEKWRLPDYLFRYSPAEETRITENLMKTWNSRPRARVMVFPSPPNIYTAPPEMLRICRDLADKYDVPVQIHVAENEGQLNSTLEDYGKREVEVLYEAQFLSHRAQLVHSVWLDDHEIDLCAKTRANIIHCPVSNMYLADGTCPVGKLLNAGVNVALGTDGPTSNNNQDMVRVLKASVLLQKVTSLNPRALTSQKALELATLGGARALGKESEIGSLEVGKKADIVLVNLLHHSLVTVHNPISSLVYAASSEAIDTVIVDGEIVMRNRKMTRVDEDEAIRKAQKVGVEIVDRSGVRIRNEGPQFAALL